MVKDIVPELLEKIKKELHLSTSKSKIIKKAIEDLDLGKATYKTANGFAKELGDILAKTLQSNIKEDVLPDGKMYYNIANRLLNETLKQNYEAIAEYSKDVQTLLNHAEGLGIRGRKADINQDRIDGLVERISESEDIDFIRSTLGEPIVNFTQSIVDDIIRVNADFHHNLGLKPKIERISNGKCCSWCSKVAGVYDYKDVKNKGNDVFRRHQYCRCEINYLPGDGRRQNAHTKKWEEFSRKEKEILDGKERNDNLNEFELYSDITEFYPTYRPGKVIELDNITIDGITYLVDGKNVVLDHDEQEIKLAKWISEKLGGDVFLVPRINIPEGIRTADYIWMNETWDLKRIKKHSKNTITTAVSNAKNQSQNVILDLQNDSYKDFDIMAEIKRVYGNQRLNFVDKIMISYNMKLMYIFKRR